MNAVTPPKLMPPFHRTSASGTFPIEHTKLTTATSGPTSGPHTPASNGWPDRKKCRQKESGTHAATAPATNSPIARSRRIAAHSITNTCDTDVNPARENSRRRNGPSPATDMSIAACPSMEPAIPRSACSRASRSSPGFRNRRNSTASTTIMIGPPTNSASVNCQPNSSHRITPSSSTRFVEPNWNAIAAVKFAPLRNSERASATAA